MLQRVGTCSECGGSVMGYRGAWMSVNPQPPDYCASCGGVAQQDIIKIHPKPRCAGAPTLGNQAFGDNWYRTEPGVPSAGETPQ